MQSREDIFRLISELQQDIELLDEVCEQNSKAVRRVESGAIDDLDYAALGYTIHNLYSLLENYALRVAKTFENDLDRDTWHRDLVKRMTIEIATIRPAVWDRGLARHIDELRRFRHAFRHVYDSSLDPEKLMIAQKHVEPAAEGVRVAHLLLLEKLTLMASKLKWLNYYEVARDTRPHPGNSPPKKDVLEIGQ